MERRRAAQGGEIQLSDDLVMRLAGGQEFGDPPALVGDLRRERVAVERVQRLHQARVGRALALAHAGPPRLGKRVEEVVGILGVGELDRSRSQRQIIVFGGNTGGQS